MADAPDSKGEFLVDTIGYGERRAATTSGGNKSSVSDSSVTFLDRIRSHIP
jgi:hypothetical protein